jgi:RNA polymerase sigma-70 factor (ECF subfamily)
MEGLTPRYRQALELRFFRDLAREECAQLMQVKLGTFDVLVLRALRAFRREWELHFASSERGER